MPRYTGHGKHCDPRANKGALAASKARRGKPIHDCLREGRFADYSEVTGAQANGITVRAASRREPRVHPGDNLCHLCESAWTE